MTIAMHIGSSNCAKKLTASEENIEKISKKLREIEIKNNKTKSNSEIGTILLVFIGALSVSASLSLFSSLETTAFITAAVFISFIVCGLNLVLK